MSKPKSINQNLNTNENKLEYPYTPRKDTSYTLHEHKIHDPYMWLEDETNEEVVAWMEGQNELVEDYFNRHDSEDVYQELLAEIDTFGRGSPYRCGEHYYWREHQPGERYYVLYRASDAWTEKDKEVVFNPNELGEEESESFFSISYNGNYAVYGVQSGGSERSNIYIRNLNTGEEEEFYSGRTFGMSWCDDERGFLYFRSDYLNRGGDIRDESHYCQVYFHKLGTEREEDELIFDAVEHGYPKEAGVSAHESKDSRFIALNIGVGRSKSYSHIMDAQTKEIQDVEVPEDSDSGIFLFDSYVYLKTDFNANNYRILRTKPENTRTPIAQWEEFIAEDPDRKLVSISATKDELLLTYSHNACNQVERLDRKTGKHIARLDLPDLAAIGAIRAHEEYEGFFYSVNTFFSPSTKYYFNPDTEESELFYKEKESLDETEFTAEQRWYESKDGTAIPMFFVAPIDYEEKDVTPVLLTGYGGFQISKEPAYMGLVKPWLERGGAFAVPCLRGGGEFGDEWHKAGKRENKQNTFDDFIAAAEYLIDEGVTQPGKIAIRGASNGGLLVGAAITQRPDLFGAAVCSVPLLDMYRYHDFLLAHRWTHEYGHPDVPEEFAWLREYSPYHNATDVEYPSILLEAGLNDSRVHPMHAWKMAAKLQNTNPRNKVLMLTQTDAGHTGQPGLQKALDENAKQLKFLMTEIGMSSLKKGATTQS